MRQARFILQGAMFAAVFAVATPVRAEALSDATQKTMIDVVRLAREIRALHPRLDDKKYVEYALGVQRAAARFQLDPLLLIAIAQQETGFRENLPEGAAGEIGIMQIRKNWVQHKAFAADLGNPTVDDMHNPAKNFMMAAWILKDLQKTVTEKGIPFWAYYNASRVENRFRYFLLVNRHLSVLKKEEAKAALASRTSLPSRSFASSDRRPQLASPVPLPNLSSWRPAARLAAE